MNRSKRGSRGYHHRDPRASSDIAMVVRSRVWNCAAGIATAFAFNRKTRRAAAPLPW
jgi:hypothetical protein